MRVYDVLTVMYLYIYINVVLEIETKLSETRPIVQHSLERIHPKVVIRLAFIFLFFAHQEITTSEINAAVVFFAYRNISASGHTVFTSTSSKTAVNVYCKL